MKNIVVKNLSKMKNKEVSHTKQEVQVIIDKKIQIFRDVIQKTILHVQKSKVLDILGISEVNNCIHSLNSLNDKIISFTNNINNITTDEVVINLQSINNDLSGILKNYGTENFEDLLLICFGNNSVVKNESETVKFDLLKKYFHPTGYKLINYKVDKNGSSNSNKKINFVDENFETSKNLDCSDISLSVKQFHLKVYGLKLYIINTEINKNLIIFGFVDDVNIKFMNNEYIKTKLASIKQFKPNNGDFDTATFNSMIESLSLKDYLIMDYQEVYNKYIGYLSNVKILKQKNLSQMVKDFVNSDLYGKRNTIIQFLITSQNSYENKYNAYCCTTYCQMMQIVI